MQNHDDHSLFFLFFVFLKKEKIRCEFGVFCRNQTVNTTITTELNTYADLNLTAGPKEDL